MIPLAEMLVFLRADVENVDLASVVDCEAEAVDYIEQATGRYFGPPVERIDYLSAAGGNEVWLSEAPIGVPVVTLDGSAVAASDYEVRGRVLRSATTWGYAGDGALVVAYTAGYPITTTDDSDEPIQGIAAPPAIRRAVKIMAAHAYTTRLPVALGTVAPEMRHTVTDTIAMFRRVSV